MYILTYRINCWRKGYASLLSSCKFLWLKGHRCMFPVYFNAMWLRNAGIYGCNTHCKGQINTSSWYTNMGTLNSGPVCRYFLGIRSANERKRYYVTHSVIGRAHTPNHSHVSMYRRTKPQIVRPVTYLTYSLTGQNIYLLLRNVVANEKRRYTYDVLSLLLGSCSVVERIGAVITYGQCISSPGSITSQNRLSRRLIQYLHKFELDLAVSFFRPPQLQHGRRSNIH